MTNRERAKAWMLERCPAEATGTRFGTEDVETIDTDTETGKPCDCLDALTKLLDETRDLAIAECVDVAQGLAHTLNAGEGDAGARRVADRLVRLVGQPLRPRS